MSDLKITHTFLNQVELHLAAYEQVPGVYGIGKSPTEASSDLLSRETYIGVEKEISLSELRHLVIARAYDRAGVGESCGEAIRNLVCPDDKSDITFTCGPSGFWTCRFRSSQAHGLTAPEAYKAALRVYEKDSVASERARLGIPDKIKLKCTTNYSGGVQWQVISQDHPNFYGAGPTVEKAYKNLKVLQNQHLLESITHYLTCSNDTSTSHKDMIRDWKQFVKEYNGTNDTDA